MFVWEAGLCGGVDQSGWSRPWERLQMSFFQHILRLACHVIQPALASARLAPWHENRPGLSVCVFRSRSVAVSCSVSRFRGWVISQKAVICCITAKEYNSVVLQLYSLFFFCKLFLILNHEFYLIAFFFLFRLHVAQQWCGHKNRFFYETCSTIFSRVTNRRARLDHVPHVLSVTQAFSVHASEWSTARVRVCVWGLQECWVGTGEARQADGTSSLCTAQLILLRIKDSRKEKSDGRSPPLSLSLARSPSSLPFSMFGEGEKNLKQKAWFICKCAAAHTGPPWCTGRGGAERARMRGNKGIVESFDSVFVVLRPSSTRQTGLTLVSISMVWNGAAITNCPTYRRVFTCGVWAGCLRLRCVCVCLALKGLRGKEIPLCLGGPLCHCCAGIELAAPHLTTAKQ